MSLHIQPIRLKVVGYVGVIAHEAAELLRRRKFSYTALALCLTAGSLYLNGVRPIAVTTGVQSPKPAANDRGVASSQLEPAQSETGPTVTRPNISSLSQTEPMGIQSQTTVTVNGTNIHVPANGNVQTTVTNNGSTTSVSVSHNSSGGNSSSSLDVQVSSQSTASEEGN